jgi:hypothetical protein
VLLDRQKTAYAKSVLRRQYTGVSQTSGTLVAGKFYRITSFVSGDDFSNVGAPSVRGSTKGHTGSVFEATGTTPSLWTHASKLTELKVAELRAKSLEVFAEAIDTVTITSGSFEGGQGSGQITFPKDVYGIAIEELLAEFDPDYTPEPRRSSGFVMQLGGYGDC